MNSHSNLAFVDDDERSRGDYGSNAFTDLAYVNNMSKASQDGSPKKSHSKQRYFTVTIMCFINLINYMDRFTIAGILKHVQDYYNIGNTEAGLLQTSFIVSYMIMAPVFGYLGDRYSRKNIIIFGVAFWSLTTVLGSIIPSNLFGIFIFLRALVGTGEASYSTIAPTIIADLFSKDQRSKMLAIFYFAIPVGSGLGYIIGYQVTVGLGEWQWALRITPILGLLSVILTVLYVKEPPRGEAEGGTTLQSTSIKSDIKELSIIKSFVLSTVGFTCVTFATGALSWFGPKYMELAIQRMSTDTAPTNAALIFGVITCIAGIVGVIIGSSGSQYFRRVNTKADPLICASGVLISVPLIFAGVVAAQYNIKVSWVLIFLGEVFLCVNWTIVADMLLYVVVPTRRSLAEAGQILISHAFGDASSPYIIGIISDAIAKNSNTVVDEFLCLQYALYLPTAVLVAGALFFFITSIYIDKDRNKCSLATHVTDDITSPYKIPEKSHNHEVTSL